MGTWPQETRWGDASGLLSVLAFGVPFADFATTGEGGYDATGTAWVTDEKAVYQPVYVPYPITVTDMVLEVGTQNGNLDVGVYTWEGARLVSSGSTAVGTAGIQVVGLADTLLTPGWHRLAMSCDSVTAAFRCSGASTTLLPNVQMNGFQQEASAFPLPATATFATMANVQAPLLGASYRATI